MRLNVRPGGGCLQRKRARSFAILFLFVALVYLVGTGRALQHNNKPSGSGSSQRSEPRKNPAHSVGDPTPASAGTISSRSDFDRLARTYYRGRFQALPHVMFVIDRRSQDRVYYINSRAYQFHKDFVNATYLSLERGQAFYDNNYIRSNRRFILGTLAYQSAVDKFAFEFWEGDQITANLLAECYSALKRTFYAPIFFKPVSKTHEEVVSALNTTAAPGERVPLLTAAELGADAKYQALNVAAGIGQLRIVERITPDTVIDRNQIVIFQEAPVHLTPLSGIITTQPASPLSHVNMLARSWGIPNATIKEADRLFKSLEGKYVRLEVRENDYTLEPADPREVDARNREWVKRGDLVTPRADLAYKGLADLARQRAGDAVRFGAKSANLGEIIQARPAGVAVPRGFAIPFHYYQEFIHRNNLEERIAQAVEEDRFVHDPRYRKSRLAQIRQWIEGGDHDPELQKYVLAKVHREYAGVGLFVRSSTNAEDLPDFSGAGLYSTVPNVRTDDQLMKAIKTVWASVWNYEAYEARESFGMNHFGVYPAVLVQEGIDADSAGVAITTDPFNRTGPYSGRGAVYINAKRGLGIRVVEGRRVAEQVIYRPRTGTIQVLTRSDEDTMLAFDERGGVKEVAIEQQRRVLTDDMVKRLARASLQIKRVFGGRDQDIEWVYRGGRLYIVQSRPYIQGE